uniref:Uncharacterized protein n=1 Tax=Russula abietina TaxID=482377 RepID=A0A2S0U3P8_9AGAM|nr:hypothetical protein [Russula abietina]AWB36121.1 hypothetical protein [Russula abietina]
MIKIFIYTYFNTFLEIINSSLNSLWLCISFLILLFIGIYFSSGAKKIKTIIKIGTKVAKAVITGVVAGASKSLADKHMSDGNDKEKDKNKDKDTKNQENPDTKNQENKSNTSTSTE